MSDKIANRVSRIVLMIAVVTLTTFMWLQAREVDSLMVEITVLEERTDELVVQNQELQDSLAEAETAYKGLSTQKEQIASTLEETQGELSKRTAEFEGRRIELLDQIKKLKQENTNLKKIEPVSSVSRGTTNSRLMGTNFQVTWYNNQGKTASGKYVKDGVTVATDPLVIPTGSLIELTFPDGRKMVREAHDTGGKVKGNIVDIYASVSTSELYKRGRTHGVTVKLLRRGW